MDPGPPRLQRRNVEVFDSEGAVTAGTSFPLITLFVALTRDAVRILAVRHCPVGRILQIHSHIHRDHDSLENFPV